MTKRQLIEKVAKNAGITQLDTRMMLDEIMTSIAEALADGESITLSQLGTFSTSIIRAHECNLTVNGKRMEIPDQLRVKYRMSSDMKRRLSKRKNPKEGRVC